MRLSAVFVVLPALACGLAAKDLPNGEGKDLTARMCVGCHGLETVTDARVAKEDWPNVVDDMIAKGAKGTPAEADIVTAYLAEHFDRPPETGAGAAGKLSASLSKSSARTARRARTTGPAARTPTGLAPP